MDEDQEETVEDEIEFSDGESSLASLDRELEEVEQENDTSDDGLS